jgi:hypothetical protein
MMRSSSGVRGRIIVFGGVVLMGGGGGWLKVRDEIDVGVSDVRWRVVLKVCAVVLHIDGVVVSLSEVASS